jgi:uncharacterized protein (TIGR02271 family)
MTFTSDQLQGLLGRGGNVVGPDGTKIGGIGQVYLDDQTGSPEWVTVKTGLFGTSESFVPLQGASASGDDIVVEFDKNKVKDAPRVAGDGHLSPQEEDELYAYYGRSHGYDSSTERVDVTENVHETVGRDTSGPTTDTAMTRSEEQLRVGVQSREAGRARLRKFVVTENVTQTVPVRREEVRVTREPITEANYPQSVDGPEITEAVHEVTLHEERPVVQKETVPVERVRLETDKVTEQVTVNETVRKEQFDLDVEGDVAGDQDLNRRL